MHCRGCQLGDRVQLLTDESVCPVCPRINIVADANRLLGASRHRQLLEAKRIEDERGPDYLDQVVEAVERLRVVLGATG